MSASRPLDTRTILKFWLPLSATWLMMSAEGPFIAAIIARMDDAKFNLAAYGIAFSFALVVESPIIMMLSASTALVGGRDSYLKLRNFSYFLNLAITLVMLAALAPPVFRLVVHTLMDLPEPIARITHLASLLLLPWPAAIGFRRFYNGIMIRSDRTRWVAYGTVIRLSTMTLTALGLFRLGGLPGACVGAAALSTGVIAEALASRFMVHRIIRELPAVSARIGLTYGEIARFYYPLALTPLLALGVMPLVTVFVGHSRFAIESLAVIPVVHSTTFIFRSSGISFQEVSVALMGEDWSGFGALRRFGQGLALIVMGLYALVVLTPLSSWWFGHVAGLSPELSRFALLPATLLLAMPALEVMLSFQRAVLVHARKTAPITWATAVEVGLILLLMLVTTRSLAWIGAVAAMTAIFASRTVHNLVLLAPCRRARPAGI